MRDFVGSIEIAEYSGLENKYQEDMHFLMCESCFWCASVPNPYLTKNETIRKCPLCDGNRIKVIPILRA
jgi:rubrerythrin